MPLPTWPSDVPYQAQVGSWSMPEPFLPPEDTEMDGGNVRRRRRPGDDVATIQFQIPMTRAEWKTLYDWLRADASGGTSRFIMSVWLGEAYYERTVMIAPGSQPTPQEYGPYVSVQMKLRVFDY